MDYFGFTGTDLEVIKGVEQMLQGRILKTPDAARLQSLLNRIIQRGSLQQLSKVLAEGADPNFIYDSCEMPLELVLRWRREVDGAADFFRELVRNGADPARSGGKETLMASACKYGNTLWAIGVLLEVAPGRIAQTDLNKALVASAHDPAMTRRLLDAGAEVNGLQISNSVLVESIPVSALMIASFFGNRDVVQTLLAAGADVNLVDADGHSALDYAQFDPSASRKVIPLLEKAGAISMKPFRRHDEATQGFAAAAKKAAYKEAVAKIAHLTGLKPSPLVGEEGRIPGGQGFLFEKTRDGKPNLPGVLTAQRDLARDFVEQHQAEILAQGYYLFYSRDILEKNGDTVALLPTADVYQVITVLETNGSGSTEDLVAWLRELEKEQPFSIFGIGFDFIDGKFITPIKDAEALARRINQICPDGGITPAEIAAQANRLVQTGRLFLWWD